MIIKLLVNGLVIGCIYGLLALGYSLIYKSSGLMSFVQGDFLTMGAYIGLALSRTDLPFYVFVPLTMVTMFIVGMLVERVIIRPLKRKNLPAIFIVLATIALSYIIQNGVQFIWGTTMMWFPSLFNVGKIKAFGLSFTMETIVCVVISIILMVILALFMKYTRLGTSLRASAINPVAAKACGVNVNFSTGLSWGLAAAIAAIAGCLLGPIYGVYATLGSTTGTKSFAAAVIGGYGNFYGAILGGVLLGLVETLIVGYISSAWKDLIAYAILLAFLFTKPFGLLNERTIQS